MSILAVMFIFLAQFIIGCVWYSKYLFGGLYASLHNMNENSVSSKTFKINIFKQVVVVLIKSIVIYFIVSEVFFLLPSSFFSIVIAILMLIVLGNYESGIWESKSMVEFLLHAGQDILALSSGFLIALFFNQL